MQFERMKPKRQSRKCNKMEIVKHFNLMFIFFYKAEK